MQIINKGANSGANGAEWTRVICSFERTSLLFASFVQSSVFSQQDAIWMKSRDTERWEEMKWNETFPSSTQALRGDKGWWRDEDSLPSLLFSYIKLSSWCCWNKHETQITPGVSDLLKTSNVQGPNRCLIKSCLFPRSADPSSRYWSISFFESVTSQQPPGRNL